MLGSRFAYNITESVHTKNRFHQCNKVSRASHGYADKIMVFISKPMDQPDKQCLHHGDEDQSMIAKHFCINSHIRRQQELSFINATWIIQLYFMTQTNTSVAASSFCRASSYLRETVFSENRLRFLHHRNQHFVRHIITRTAREHPSPSNTRRTGSHIDSRWQRYILQEVVRSCPRSLFLKLALRSPLPSTMIKW